MFKRPPYMQRMRLGKPTVDIPEPIFHKLLLDMQAEVLQELQNRQQEEERRQKANFKVL